MTVRFQMDLKGLGEYLERLVQAEKDVDQAAAKALSAGGDVILGAMLDKVPVLTGNLKSNLVRTEPRQDGNFIYVEVGIRRDVDKDTAIYGNVQEYGSVRLQAQPYVRPAFDENKGRASAAQRDVLKAEGFI